MYTYAPPLDSIAIPASLMRGDAATIGPEYGETLYTHVLHTPAHDMFFLFVKSNLSNWSALYVIKLFCLAVNVAFDLLCMCMLRVCLLLCSYPFFQL